jgi:hypothetical protein
MARRGAASIRREAKGRPSTNEETIMNRTLFLSAALILSSTCAFAQPMHERREEGQDRRELRKDRREIREDFHDLRTLEALRADFDAARARRDRGALQALDNRLREHVRDELADDVGDLRRARTELRGDRRELRGDERRLERGREEGRLMAAQSEHRELREDARDAAAHRAYLERHREVLRRLERLAGRLDPEALNHKRAAIDELIGIARSELHQDKYNIREDRRDLREGQRDEHHH